MTDNKEEIILKLEDNLNFVNQYIQKGELILKEYKLVLKRAKKEGRFYLKSENKFWATAEMRGKAASYDNIIQQIELQISKIEEGLEKMKNIKKDIVNDLARLNAVDNI